MTLRSHHAHICIGRANEYSKQTVLDYLVREDYREDTAEIQMYEMELFTIDDARELKRIVSEKTYGEKKLVVLILTSTISYQAQNALLKTLEEPQEGVMIIFVTPHEHTLQKTLLSRVVVHYIAQEEITSPIDAKMFAKGNSAKRLKLIEDFVQKIKNDETLHESSRKDALNFLNAYEAELYALGDVSAHTKEYYAIFFAKKYISDIGSSVKQLLEYVALMK